MAKCKLCERTVGRTSRHHLLPLEKGGKYSETVDLCQPCHATIHHTFSNQALAKQYNTLAALQSAEALQSYLAWIRKRTIERIVFD